MTKAYGARVRVHDGQVEITMSCVIDGVEHYVQCPVGDGFYFAQRALEKAAELARQGGLTSTLAKAVYADERQHGGLLSRSTAALADEVLSERV